MESRSIRRAGGFGASHISNREANENLHAKASIQKVTACVWGGSLLLRESKMSFIFLYDRPPSLLLSCQHLIPLLSSFSHSSFCTPHRFFSLFFPSVSLPSRFWCHFVSWFGRCLFSCKVFHIAYPHLFPFCPRRSVAPLRLHSRLKDYFTLLDIAVIKPLSFFTAPHSTRIPSKNVQSRVLLQHPAEINYLCFLPHSYCCQENMDWKYWENTKAQFPRGRGNLKNISSNRIRYWEIPKY